jgi:16S rRNA (uracil1498-N3)-methyltransferase
LSIFYQPKIATGAHYLDEPESKHCTRALRKQSGDDIQLIDGNGYFYRCRIVDSNPKKCTFTILETKKESPKNFRVHIAIAPTKNQDRIEWFVEKVVEIGVDAISFVGCENSERYTLKMDRIRKAAISAMKQSQRASLPTLAEVIDYKAFIQSIKESQRFIAHVDRDNPDHLLNECQKESSVIVLIGPEGDFSPEELQLALNKNFRKVSLGNARLRTETAGIVASHIINLINRY